MRDILSAMEDQELKQRKALIHQLNDERRKGLAAIEKQERMNLEVLDKKADERFNNCWPDFILKQIEREKERVRIEFKNERLKLDRELEVQLKVGLQKIVEYRQQRMQTFA